MTETKSKAAPKRFIYAPNPVLNASEWELQYPKIQTKSKWLINKYTGEIFPNTEEFARRSDILEPYIGYAPFKQPETIEALNQAIEAAAPDGDGLEEL